MVMLLCLCVCLSLTGKMNSINHRRWQWRIDWSLHVRSHAMVVLVVAVIVVDCCQPNPVESSTVDIVVGYGEMSRCMEVTLVFYRREART